MMSLEEVMRGESDAGDADMVACVNSFERGSVQIAWATLRMGQRVAVLRRARHLLAGRVDALCGAISPELARNDADTMVAEVLPLLAACQFLEQEAAGVLATRRLGRRRLPFWLRDVDAEVQRVALGRVLVIGPGNYPLFLPGVQALQGLAAGNAVVWKPGRGGRAVAEVFAGTMREAGLPEGLLRVTDESVEAAEGEIAAGVDKVFFTGSAATARILLKRLAETLTPCVVEASGCDAVVVLPSADVERVVKALVFGMRLNGSATCMAPRRVVMVRASEARRAELVGHLLTQLDWVGGVRLAGGVRRQLDELLDAAVRDGAQVHGEQDDEQQPIVVTNVRPEMELARADVFAPVLIIMDVGGVDDAVAAVEACPYGLTVAVFGEEREARALGGRLTVGTVVVNDLIVATADPRVPFGGRKQSGFGVTRGAEGLLEMTAVKVLSVRKGKGVRQYEATTAGHAHLFRGAIRAAHGGTVKEWWRGLMAVVKAGRRMK